MADTPKVMTYDLTRDVPSGITLSGLSEPKFDGTNYFRQPLSQKSEIVFQIDNPGFAQLEYQLYSSTSAVTGLMKLDGKELNVRVFPADKFTGNVVAGDFISAGTHTLKLDYQCQPICQTPPSQYWTKLHIIDHEIPQAIQKVGLNVVRLNQYAPDTSLKLSGVGSLQFDGVNFFRPVEGNMIDFGWPGHLEPLDVSFQLLGNQRFKVIAKNTEEIIGSGSGSTKKDVFLHVKLIGKRPVNRIQIEIKCLDNPALSCTNLYFPSITARETSANWTNSLPLSLGSSLILLTALVWLLFPKRQSV